jgi:type IV pilus assembly protein PilZ
MASIKQITYAIHDPLEINLYYMPFIKGGGFFIPTADNYKLGEEINLTLSIPGKTEPVTIEGKIVWITPKNALHHVLPGIGIQFGGANAAGSKTLIESHLDSSVEVGGYTYGFKGEMAKKSK